MVRRIWARLLGDAAVDENKTWEAAGGDSLKALELIFELEMALNRRISMQCIGPRTRPRQLAATLQAAAQNGCASPGRDALPLVFLLPGAGGYFSILCDLRMLFRAPPMSRAGFSPIHRGRCDHEFGELVVTSWAIRRPPRASRAVLASWVDPGRIA